MKNLLWIVLGFAVVGLTALLVTMAGPPPRPLQFLLVLLFAVAPMGAFWMVYQAIRYERQPFPLVVFALFVPFAFLWYYFERVRPGKHKTRTEETGHFER